MDATRYISRVGALAVALGIGAAMSTGAPSARAEGPDSTAGSSNNGADASVGASGATSGPARTGPLSAVGDRIRKETDTSRDRRAVQRDRIRKEIDTRLDGLGDAVEHVRSEAEKVPTRLYGRRAELRATHNDVARAAATPPAPLAGLRRAADKTERRQIVPDAVNAVPDLRRPKRASVVAEKALGKVVDASDHAQRTAVALPPPPSTMRSDATPVTTAPSKTIEASRMAEDAVVTTLLATVGLSPSADSSPHTPGPSPFVLAVMAWTRRETSQALGKNEITVPGGQVAALVAADDVYDANPGRAPAPVVPDSLADGRTDLGLVTGNPTAHWFVAGTDLGIMWDSGYIDDATQKPIVYSLFGDSYSDPGMAGDWRNNVLFRTIDTDLNGGLEWNAAVINAGAQYPGDPNGTPTWYGTGGPRAGAMQIITDPGVDGLFGNTYTLIPTAAIAVPDATAEGDYVQYATVMSVRTWDTPGRWTTNYSAIAYSADGGETWAVDSDTVRSSGWLRSSKAYVPGDEHFQQNALVYGNPDDPDSWTASEGDLTRERYVYVYGTPSGRQGSAYLARVPESQLRQLDKYQYWTGKNSDGTGNWATGDPSAAVPVIGSSENDLVHAVYKVFDCFTFGLFSKILNGIWVGGLPTFGNVSEMSVQYNEYAGRYLVTYTDGRNDVVLRVSDTPQGNWSDSITLMPRAAGWYAPMIHPLSGTAASGAGNQQYLYYNLSNWDQYNVHLMRTDISALQAV
nr:DUF4185 domain-containing protein [Mycobacterium sp.]